MRCGNVEAADGVRGCWRTLREGTTDQRRKYCWHFVEKAMPTPLKTLFLQIKLCLHSCAAEIAVAMTDPMRVLVTLDTGCGQQRSVMLPDPRTGEMHAPWPPCQLACRHTPPCITMHPSPSTRHVHTHPAHYMHMLQHTLAICTLTHNTYTQPTMHTCCCPCHPPPPGCPGKPRAYMLAADGSTVLELQRYKSTYSSWVVQDTLVAGRRGGGTRCTRQVWGRSTGHGTTQLSSSWHAPSSPCCISPTPKVLPFWDHVAC